MESNLTILALAPSTKSGWALSGGISGTWDCSIRRDESAGMRLIRLRSKLREFFGMEFVNAMVEHVQAMSR